MIHTRRSTPAYSAYIRVEVVRWSWCVRHLRGRRQRQRRHHGSGCRRQPRREAASSHRRCVCRVELGVVPDPQHRRRHAGDVWRRQRHRQRS
jgi:hypothetical protein